MTGCKAGPGAFGLGIGVAGTQDAVVREVTTPRSTSAFGHEGSLSALVTDGS
ncbi:hypothetical protein JOE58_000476 [Curtobacterium luteum]|uniref:Uncharacterized protein n=1 Tax=Curtobacterium luteum TaxID=33881 RepID=A0ABS2RQE1_9MICO|nr:hypothetical protein [Curtobacterium luteum]MBM7801225.1 hypothetical protein [Curtobacterium luteum]